MNVTAVIVSIEVKLPKSNLIKVEEVIIHGSGTLTEALDGGQSSFSVTLTHGRELKPLAKGESVFVQGEMNGHAFKLPAALKVITTVAPWEFQGKSGSTG
jgi:hypothetical protein